MKPRAQRRAETEKQIKQRSKVAEQFKIEKPSGYWRERKPLDCGCTRCRRCHDHKINNESNKTRRREGKRELTTED